MKPSCFDSGFLESLQYPSRNSTWFISSDSAFRNLTNGLQIEELIRDTSVRNNNFIRKLLLYNMVNGSFAQDDFYDGQYLESLYSAPVLASPGAFSNKTREQAGLVVRGKPGNWSIVRFLFSLPP